MEHGLLSKHWWEDPMSRASVLREAIDQRDRDAQQLGELRKMLVGPEFHGELRPGDEGGSPTNSMYAFYARISPECIGGDLRAVADTELGAREEPFALRLEHMVNEACRRTEAQNVLEMVVADMACGYGGVLVRPSAASALQLTDEMRLKLEQPLGVKPRQSKQKRKPTNDRGAPVIEPTPITDADPRLPGIIYLDPSTWGWDRRAYTIENAEFCWYETVHNIAELLELADADGSAWDKAAIAEVEGRMANNLGQQSRKLGKGDPGLTTESPRQKIILLNLWVRTARLEGDCPEGHHGVWYTMWVPSDTDAAVEVRKPEWAFCPSWGPFVLFAQHLTGEDSKPFSAPGANAEKLRANDAVHTTAYKKIKSYRRNFVADARTKKQLQDVDTAGDGELLFVNGLAEMGGITPIERGGLDQHTLAAIQYLDARLAEDLGLAPNERGAVQGSGTTATESAFANGRASAFSSEFRRRFNVGLARVYRTMAWYAAFDEQFLVPADFATRVRTRQRRIQEAAPDLGDMEAAAAARRVERTGESPGMMLAGGDFSDDPTLDFNAIRWSVDEYKQRPRNETERRMENAQFRADLANILMMMAQLPFFDWMSELRQLEEDYGRRGIVDRVDAAMLSMMAQAQIEQPQQALESGMLDPAKRTSSAGGPTISFLPGQRQQQRAPAQMAAPAAPAAPAGPAMGPTMGGM